MTFLQFACMTTSYVSMQVLQPADIIISPQIRKIAIMNNSFFPFQKPNSITKKVSEIDSLAGIDFISGLVEIMTSSPRYEVTLPYSDDITPDIPNHIDIDWNLVEKICAIDTADALLVLDSIANNGDNNIQTVYIRGEQYAILPGRVNLGINIKLYCLSNKKIIDNQSWKINDIYNTEQNICDYAYSAGKKYGKRITPTWKDVYRNYFYGNEEMQKAVPYVRTQNWTDAATIWREFTIDKNPRIAAMSCFNMALASEMLDKLDLAKSWIDMAVQKRNDPIIIQYKNAIYKRIDDEKLLNAAFGD